MVGWFLLAPIPGGWTRDGRGPSQAPRHDPLPV